MTTKEAIKQESEDCAKSANDMRNTPMDREIFYVLSIVLGGIAEKLESPTDQQMSPEVRAIGEHSNMLWSRVSKLESRIQAVEPESPNSGMIDGQSQ